MHPQRKQQHDFKGREFDRAFTKASNPEAASDVELRAEDYRS